MTMIERIKAADTMPKLDELRLEIVQDRENFEENQKAFRKQKNKLKRIPLKDRNW